MGTIARAAGAPFIDGEVVNAGPVEAPVEHEADLQTIYNEANGSVQNANFDAAADIQGSKFATNTIPGAKFASDAVDTAELLDKSVENAQVVDGAADTVHLAAGAASDVQEATGDDLQLAQSDLDWNEVVADTVETVEAPNAVLLLFSAEVIRGQDQGGWNGSGKTFEYRVLRNAASIVASEPMMIYHGTQFPNPITAGFRNFPGDNFTFMYVDQTPTPLSTVTYSVELRNTQNVQRDWFFREVRIALINMRR